MQNGFTRPLKVALGLGAAAGRGQSTTHLALCKPVQVLRIPSLSLTCSQFVASFRPSRSKGKIGKVVYIQALDASMPPSMPTNASDSTEHATTDEDISRQRLKASCNQSGGQQCQ
eukprot:6175658-Pleurochrysis_carterae.AAC.1